MDLVDPTREGGAGSFPRERGDGPRRARRRSGAPEFPPRARGWTVMEEMDSTEEFVSPASAGMDRYPRHPPIVPQRFPRERGDGPATRLPRFTASRFPPRARGWTLDCPDIHQTGHVSPASAGMDLPRTHDPRRARSFPRERGDGPLNHDHGLWIIKFPPRARGWTSRAGQVWGASHVSPASAGMDPGCPRAGGRPRCFPRERGDGPATTAPNSAKAAFPPRARGWTPRLHLVGRPGRVSPASAGMDPAAGAVPSGSTRFPRERGDGPPVRRIRPGAIAVSPASAGMDPRPRCPETETTPVSPASAGMDRWPGSRSSGRSRFPRERGDGPLPRRRTRCSRSFPPRARGWTRRTRPNAAARSVSPASAGMDPRRPTATPGLSGFPRERGDGPKAEAGHRSIFVFPPRARGWTRRAVRILDAVRVSPASAGMDLAPGRRTPPPRCFPRERGDGPVSGKAGEAVDPFPPRARGWTLAPECPQWTPSVSPASAGMDLGRSRLGAAGLRFPRERGDGPLVEWRDARTTEFPPRARGWTVIAMTRTSAGMVSPASAGMDHNDRPVSSAQSSFPRERGDGPSHPPHHPDPRRFPPRARGWTVHDPEHDDDAEVSPASAGMDRRETAISAALMSFPRERGDGPPDFLQSPPLGEFPPRARGWTRAVICGGRGRSVSPASAGMDLVRTTARALPHRFPRERGDGPRPRRPDQ